MQEFEALDHAALLDLVKAQAEAIRKLSEDQLPEPVGQEVRSDCWFIDLLIPNTCVFARMKASNILPF